MKKLLFVFIAYSFLSVNSFGQESYIKNRLNFKAGYSRVKTNKYDNHGAITVGNYRIEANYGILNNLETGIYFGYSKFSVLTNISATWTSKDYSTPYYGLNCNFHLLPFIVKGDDFRFDLYLTGKFGGLYFATPDGSNSHGHITEYGLGGGFCFYLWKHLGLFTEYSYGKYFYKENQNLKYGLAFKF